MLSSIFDSSDDINILAKSFLKKLDGCIAINFKKIRVSHTKESDEDKLYKKMRELKDKEDNKSKTELDNIIKDIAKISE
jgi:hemerythrin superfamily protein